MTNFKYLRLTDICTPKQWKTIPMSELSDSGYLCYGANGVIGHYKEYNHEDETIMIGCRGSCGGVNISKPKSYINGNAMCLESVNSQILKKYLYFALKSVDFKKIITGSSQPQITIQGLSKVYVKVYDQNTQKYIVDVLEKCDEIIKQIVLLYDKYNLLIKSQFIEMFGNKQETILLNKISTIIMGQSPNGSTYNKSSMGLPFYQGKTDFGETYINSPSTWTTRPTKIAESDDILLSVRAPVGSTNICNLKCCIGRGLAAIKPNKNLATSYYLLYSLRYIQNEIEDLGTGSTFKCISKNQVSTLKVPCSDYATQLVFSNFVNQIDKSKLINVF